MVLIFKKVKVAFSALTLFVVMTAAVSVASALEKLQIVPTEKVCMVTNMVFPRPQIPVVHAGKTYYGCCENCKKTLSEDSASRIAIDPVSGKSVDKAKAVVAARDDGSVVYFESRQTFDLFTGNSKSKKSK